MPLYKVDFIFKDCYNFDMISNVIKVKLKELLAKQNKSIYQLQQETGITYPTLHKITNGKVEAISFKVLEKLCDNLQCTPNDLLSIEK
ncbi:MAG: helix-turn-helix transcriptional regulator [Pyrinomonadaceae bacterium]